LRRGELDVLEHVSARAFDAAHFDRIHFERGAVNCGRFLRHEVESLGNAAGTGR